MKTILLLSIIFILVIAGTYFFAYRSIKKEFIKNPLNHTVKFKLYGETMHGKVVNISDDMFQLQITPKKYKYTQYRWVNKKNCKFTIRAIE